jgi:adenylate kinase family enzyme
LRAVLTGANTFSHKMKRIIIVGSGGSGKSTLAHQLGELLHLNVIHLDALFWKPGWVRVSNDEQQRILADAIERDEWIIDGDHVRTQGYRFAAADTIIFLNFPRTTCLWRVFKRRLQYRGTNRLGLARGCPKRLNWTLLKWVWRYPVDVRPQVVSNIQKHSHGRKVIVLRSPAQVENFINTLKQGR